MLYTRAKKWTTTSLVVMLYLLTIAGTPAMAADSPSQIIGKSADVMSKLKSFHGDFTSTELVHSEGRDSTYTINGTADAANTNQMQIKLLRGSDSLATVVSTGQNVYVQRGTGPWYVTNIRKLPNDAQKYISQGLPKSIGQLLSALQKARLEDKGQETVGNTKLHHITATLDPQSLRTLTQQLNGMLPSKWQSNQNQLQRGVVDLWIDPTTSYLHQMNIDTHAQVDQKVLSQGVGLQTRAAVVPVDARGQLKLSKFDQAFTIQIPRSATPYPTSKR